MTKEKKLKQKFPTVKFWYPELSNISLDAKIGKRTKIHSHCWISDGVEIGSHVRIQAFCFLPYGITVEDDVFLGPRVTFINDPKMEMERSKWAKTVVKRGARIGASATIQAGITIGKYAVIGAGSVVLRDVPDGETWVGVPAFRVTK